MHDINRKTCIHAGMQTSSYCFLKPGYKDPLISDFSSIRWLLRAVYTNGNRHGRYTVCLATSLHHRSSSATKIFSYISRPNITGKIPAWWCVYCCPVPVNIKHEISFSLLRVCSQFLSAVRNDTCRKTYVEMLGGASEYHFTSLQ